MSAVSHFRTALPRDSNYQANPRGNRERNFCFGNLIVSDSLASEFGEDNEKITGVRNFAGDTDRFTRIRGCRY